MEEEKEIKTDTDIKEASELKNEAGFNISAEYAESLPDTKPEPEKRSTASELFEWLDVLVTAIISVVVIFSFIFRVATISGRSMTNTLQDADKVIITNLAYFRWNLLFCRYCDVAVSVTNSRTVVYRNISILRIVWVHPACADFSILGCHSNGNRPFICI